MARSKYGSRRTYVAELGRTFASQREADAAVTLWRRQQAGEIRYLRFQVPYRLEVRGVLICTYVADFAWCEPRERRDVTRMTEPLTYGPPYLAWTHEVVADAKGYRTAVYKLKVKLMLAIHGIEIREL
jgi:hypothetical protein